MAATGGECINDLFGLCPAKPQADDPFAGEHGAACLHAGGHIALLEALSTCADDSAVLDTCAQGISNLSWLDRGREALLEVDAPTALGLALRRGLESDRYGEEYVVDTGEEHICQALVNLSSRPEGAEECGAATVVKPLVDALYPPTNPKGSRVAYAAWALGNIAWGSAHGCLTVVESHGVSGLVRLLEDAPLTVAPHAAHPRTEAQDAHRAAASALCNICDASGVGLEACKEAGWSRVALDQITEGKLPLALHGAWGTLESAQRSSPLVGQTLNNVLRRETPWPEGSRGEWRPSESPTRGEELGSPLQQSKEMFEPGPSASVELARFDCLTNPNCKV